MAKAKTKIDARTFYLNEQHELTRGEKISRGGNPKLGEIDWGRKGQKISRSINHVRDALKKSKDPLREQRYFLLARPLKEVPKRTDNKKKAPEGHFLEVTSYNDEHSLVFKKLGMDLIQVNDDGTATVHARPERIEQLGATANNLADVGVTEQSRWVTIDAFDLRVQVPVPQEWLAHAKAPHMRLVVSWDSPVNAAVNHIWASRKVNVQLRARPETEAIRSSRTGHFSYPLTERLYDLNRLPEGVKPQGDSWLLEISYGIIADYYPGIDFSPIQRVAFAAELIDLSEEPHSAQLAMQALPAAPTMQRLSAAAVPIRNLVAIKYRL